MRSAITLRSCSGPKMPASAHVGDLVRVRVDVPPTTRFGCATGIASTVSSRLEVTQCATMLEKNSSWRSFVDGDPADQALQHGSVI